jgi:hypothetical protein
MIRIAITQAAYAAIAATLPFGAVAVEPGAGTSEHHVWLAPNVVDRLGHLLGPGESYSDVILRLIADTGASWEHGMIRIAITQAAFDAIAVTLPLGSVAYEPAVDVGDLRYIWLEPRWLERLNSYRGPGESYSEVILWLAGEGG